MAKAQVLIVDDDWLNVEVMETFLQADGYEVASASSGEHALDYIRRKIPDIILMDVRMSGMNGFETCAVLKADPQSQHIPVLLVTGYNSDEDITKAIEAGADDLLFKPIRSQLMLMRVRSLVRIKQLYDQLHA